MKGKMLLFVILAILSTYLHGQEINFNSFESSTALCTQTALVCGGSFYNVSDSLDPNSLYKCSIGSAPVLAENCSFTCVAMSSNQYGHCTSLGDCSTKTSYNGHYCGDRIQGDPRDLYICADGKPAGAMVRVSSFSSCIFLLATAQ